MSLMALLIINRPTPVRLSYLLLVVLITSSDFVPPHSCWCMRVWTAVSTPNFCKSL